MAVSNIVVAGKSGAGKQPRIDVLVETYGLHQLSTGNIFREYLGAFAKIRDQVKTHGLFGDEGFADDGVIGERLAQASEAASIPLGSAVLGFKASQYVERGLFVPDAITNALLSAAFEGRGGTGLVLDGYPRTVEQSEHLLDLVGRTGSKLDLVLVVDNDDETIVARTVGRRICPSKTCGRVFHLEYRPPSPEGTCTACGTPVVHRSDDTEDKIRTRLLEFQNKAKPAIERLVASGVPSVSIPGNLPVFTDQAVRESVLESVRPLLG